VNRASRLVSTPSAFPIEREEMLAVGMGAVYTRTSHGGQLRADDPAHAAGAARRLLPALRAGLSDHGGRAARATGRAVILDVHSYPRKALPYELHGDGARPAVCLGTDVAHSPPDLIVARGQQAFAGCGDVALDTPFAGCYVPLAHYRRHSGVTALMLELRRDIVAERLDALAAALAALSARR
jgi:hypothetical protein